jgi:membrane-associated phospholipid phosphatase
MLLWFGLLLLAGGSLCFAIDRRAAHFFHDAIHQRWAAIIHRTTDWAKGSHWLLATGLALAAAWALQRLWGPTAVLVKTEYTAVAFLASLVAASAILHVIKLLLGRRRPRDELELGLYGFRPFHFDLQYDSFPSGHALTIFCVAVILAGALPQLALLWFAIAIYLAMTRAFLNSHYLSDVCFGAGIAVVATREVMLMWFPALTQGWM